ncbi:MAG: Ldh family oxidoreductase [Anaerolineae bacterium]|nr:Ldh family oxidoreductase [Anaerolineae bacterium]
MPTLPYSTLTDLIRAIFQAAGAPPDIALQVAESLVTTNLTGHDSHGIIRVKTYVEQIKKGALKPAARAVVSRRFGATAVLDGQWGFGQVTARTGAQLARDLAQDYGLGAVVLSNVNHIGRLGEYAEIIAQAGMVGTVMTGGTLSRPSVTPYGGAEAIFGTNPMAWAVPAGDQVLLSDFATAAVANGKIKVALDKGEAFPADMLLDKEGRPTTNPADFYDDGMLLPFGSYKGYGLNLMMEIIPVLLSGFAPITSPDFRPGNPTFMLATSIEAFTDRAYFEQQVVQLKARVKQVRPSAGSAGVLLPGEKESRTMAERLRDGIPLPDKTWVDLGAVAAEWGVTMPALD